MEPESAATTSSQTTPSSSPSPTLPKTTPTTLTLEPYTNQMDRWPLTGRHILAHYDDTTIIVHQAFNPEIASYAVHHQKFGGPFKLSRMSWIKTNFAWMQYRSGWNTKSGQERTLAVKISRQGFDTILSHAVEGHYSPDCGLEEKDWLEKKNCGDVRLQWDPDYFPVLNPTKLERRAIQLGLKGEILKMYAQQWIVSIEDITDFVVEMRGRLERQVEAEAGTETDAQAQASAQKVGNNVPKILTQIYTPSERIYVPHAKVYKNLNMAQHHNS